MDRRNFLGGMGGIAILRNVRADPAKVHRIGSLNFPSLRPAIKKMLLGAFSERGYVEGQQLAHRVPFRGTRTAARNGCAVGKLRARTNHLWLIRAGSSVDDCDQDRAGCRGGLRDRPHSYGVREESRARPGGNLTGTFLDLPELSAKRLEILKETMPIIKRVAALWIRRSIDRRLRRWSAQPAH